MQQHSNTQEKKTEGIDVVKLIQHVEPASFLKRLPDIIPFLDPDSTRFTEWLSSYRFQAGMSTFSDYFLIPEEFGRDSRYKKTVQEMTDPIIQGRFNQIFRSKDTFRAYRLDSNGIPEFYMLLGPTSGNRNVVVATGNENEVREVMAYYEKTFVIPQSINIDRLIGFSADGSPAIRSEKISEDEIDLAHDDFYPYFEQSLDEMAAEYKESKAPVLVLIGKWGTGKTTFLRTLFFKMGYKSIAAITNEVALANPNLSHWIENLENGTFIFIEDADNLIGKRADGNHQMTSLLNFTQGVKPTQSKLVISTNLQSTKNIDDALIRPGRAYKVLKFRDLIGQEINNARAAIGKSAIEITDKTEMTLSEALNYESITNLAEHRTAGIGFK